MGECGAARSVFPGQHWEAVESPGVVGWCVEKLAEVRGMARGVGSTAVMVVHKGRVVLSYGDVGRPTIAASVRKSLLSALYGIHVAAGTIDLNATLADLGIDDIEPSLTDAEKQATVVDLLRSKSGVYHLSNSTTDWEKSQIPPRGTHRPGTYWAYNNWDFNALGTIFEQRVKRSLFVEFQERIAVEIGMEQYGPQHGMYFGQYYSQHAAYHFNLSARDLARFGLLYLNGGSWNSKQIVPSVWVAESTRAHSWSPSGSGYGYMWWVGIEKPVRTPAEEHSFSARGHRGQLVHVFPALDLVFVHQYAATRDDDQGISENQIYAMLNLVLEAMPGAPRVRTGW